MSVVNVTFSGYGSSSFIPLEACGKCRTGQGGYTSFTSGLTFLQWTATSSVVQWSWDHQVCVWGGGWLGEQLRRGVAWVWVWVGD